MGVCILSESSIYEKIKYVEQQCHDLLLNRISYAAPIAPARDVEKHYTQSENLRLGLQSRAGQAKLLHDLANIELQAMELGVRTLLEFPDSPKHFREELADITLEESRHLSLCLKGIESLGHTWGDWRVHTNLWDTARAQDTLVDRVFSVNCYLEGSGLDSGEVILSKLSGVENKTPREIVKIISTDEIRHVHFGIKWFRELSQNENFFDALQRVGAKLPARSVKISVSNRIAAGFLNEDIEALQQFHKQK